MSEHFEKIIKVTGLTKHFQNIPVVNDISFSLHPGDVFGLIGPNGAGKTTTLRILATVLKKDSGDVEIGGIHLDYKNNEDLIKIRSLTGFMPDFLGLYDNLLVREYLEFYASAFSTEETLRPYVIDEALETAGIMELKNKEIEKLSRGMKQRTALARVLIHNPRVLLLDEPASGLDPRSRAELRDIIKGLHKKGKTIIISSHILEDIEDFCNNIGIIDKGQLVKFEDKNKLAKETMNNVIYRISVLNRTDDVKNLLASKELVKNLIWEENNLRFEFLGDDREASILLKELINQDFQVASFSKEEPSLEDIYLKFTDIKSSN